MTRTKTVIRTINLTAIIAILVSQRYTIGSIERMTTDLRSTQIQSRRRQEIPRRASSMTTQRDDLTTALRNTLSSILSTVKEIIVRIQRTSTKSSKPLL